jgi:hypothetical protein
MSHEIADCEDLRVAVFLSYEIADCEGCMKLVLATYCRMKLLVFKAR